MARAELYNHMLSLPPKNKKLQKNGLIINMQLEILKILIMTQEEIGFLVVFHLMKTEVIQIIIIILKLNLLVVKFGKDNGNVIMMKCNNI